MAASIGTISVDIRASTTTLRRDMADASTITKQGTAAMDTNFKNLQKTTDTTGRSIYEMTRVTRALSLNLVNEVSPAIGRVVGSTQGAAAAFRGFGAVGGLVGIAIATAAAGLGQYLSAVNEAAKAQAQFNLALRSGDIGALRQQLAAANQELETFRVNEQTAAGRARNLATRAAIATGLQPDPAEVARRAREGIAQLLSVESSLATAAMEKQTSAANTLLIEQSRLRAELNLDEKSFTALTEGLLGLIDAELRADDVITTVNADLKERAAIVRGATQAEIDTIHELRDAELEANLARANARRAAIRTESQRRVTGIRERIRGTEPDVGEATAEQLAPITEAMQGLNEPMIVLGRDMETIRRSAQLMGRDFDRAEAELEATRRAIIDFDFATDNAQETFAKLNARFQELDQLAKTKELLHDFTATFQAGISSSIAALLNGQMTVAQSFVNLGRTIAAGLVDSVVNRGFKVLNQALDDFLYKAQKSGLWESILGALGGLFGGAAGAATGAVALDAGGALAAGGAGVGAPYLADGGIIRRPMLAMVGEAGPEAVIPLSQLGGAGGTEVNIYNQAPNTDVGYQSRQDQGRTVHEIVVREVSRSMQSGEMDTMLRSQYGLRRQAVSR